jgi:putative ABC transport system permease protein
MKYFPLIWSGLWRKPSRTILIALSITVAFLLFGLLRGMLAGLDGTIKEFNANNMIVRSDGRERPLPAFYTDRIKRVPNVVAVYSVTELDGYYQDKSNLLRTFALGGDATFDAMTEYRVPREQFAEFKRTRNGAIIGRRLAQQYGWKIGDRVPLISDRWVQRDGSRVWTFDIVGIYDRPTEPDLAGDFWLNYEYLDEGRIKGNGSVDMFLLRTSGPKLNAQVAADVDALFASSESPTRTQTQREMLLSTIDQVMNVGLIVNTIVGASFFTLVLLAATSMMQSAQQRVPEFAVLKTIGLPDMMLFTLIIAEGLLLCVLAALCGLSLAAILFPRLSALGGLNGISIPPQVIGEGLAIAVAIALVTSAAPAWRTKRLTVVKALVKQH